MSNVCHIKYQVIASLFMLIPLVHSWALTSDTIFARHFAASQAIAKSYPREKVHLHFDNTSYYIGDTIWYKAYVVTAEKNLPSSVSRPLYVELISQLGSVIDKQIVQLTNGEGHSQFILDTTFFSGYYEIRAYTKWMQAFDDRQYFSKVLPVYRKKRNQSDNSRSILTYRMDESMKQRPHHKPPLFTLRFFPEGGQVVQRLQSSVAFKAESREGPISISGVIRSEDGRRLAAFTTTHDGMGCFGYTPLEKPATAEVIYKGKQYRFPLPEAAPLGYILKVINRDEGMDIRVTRNSNSLNDTLAIFVSSQGRPFTYAIVNFDNKSSCRLQIPRNKLAEGVIQVSLINPHGETLCERFCFIMPQDEPQIKGDSVQYVYPPYAPIHYHLTLKDAQGNPIQGHFSVAIRDALNSDYRKYDETIYTNLLLTSDLKGYIHQPGYYFANRSAQRQAELDILMMIHGWRKYDMAKVIGVTPSTPSYTPEKNLILHGEVRSLAFNVKQKYINVSILARLDSTSIAGTTTTDSTGYFNIPVEEFEGTAEAVIQTRRQGKELNRQTSVVLFRNFEPPLREYTFEETHPVWQNMERMQREASLRDSLYLDSLLKDETYLIDQVNIEAHRKKTKKTQAFEQSVLAYYNVPYELDKLRDANKPQFCFSELLEALNPDIKRVSNGEGTSILYKNSPIMYIVNGELYTPREMDVFIENSIDAIHSVMLYNRSIANGQTENEPEDFNLFLLNETAIKKYMNNGIPVCYITTREGWKPDKGYAVRGIRYTRIQGYNRPLEFYSPAYPLADSNHSNDRRRTLYWNPNVETNEKGEAIIHCYNAQNTTYVTVSVETLCNGKPAALNVLSEEPSY